MLQDGDLDTFLDLYRVALTDINGVEEHPNEAIVSASGDLCYAEIFRLSKSMQIAFSAGDAPEHAARALERIFRSLGNNQKDLPNLKVVALKDRAAWSKAIRWSQTSTVEVHFLERYLTVGQACRRLRTQRYKIRITAYGAEIDPKSGREIAEKIDSLLVLLGKDAAYQICGQIIDHNRLHDGMWLFGDIIPGYGQMKPLGLPIGWLFPLALRHIFKRNRAQNPKVAWRTVVELAMNVTLCLDCQRFNQFELMDIHYTEFWRFLVDSLRMRELFSLPQVPQVALPIMRAAFQSLEWPKETEQLAKDVESLFAEIEHLLNYSTATKFSHLQADQVEKTFPLIWRYGRISVGNLNPDFKGPFSDKTSDHTSYVFFACENNVALLPSPLLTASFCEVVFRFIWNTATAEDAKNLTGKFYEKAVEFACRGKAEEVISDLNYRVGKSNGQIDLVTRSGNLFTFFETKGKNITSHARSGDILKFIDDYTKSYLHLVKQLIVREHHLRGGKIKHLTSEIEATGDLRPLKIAVSPLSFGPVSDPVHSNALLRGMINVHLNPIEITPRTSRIINDFNKTMDEIMEHVFKLAPKKDGAPWLHAYLKDVLWLDLGQLIYILTRGKNVYETLSRLRNFTFSSGDFWTEVAFSDRANLNATTWYPPTHASSSG